MMIANTTTTTQRVLAALAIMATVTFLTMQAFVTGSTPDRNNKWMIGGQIVGVFLGHGFAFFAGFSKRHVVVLRVLAGMSLIGFLIMQSFVADRRIDYKIHYMILCGMYGPALLGYGFAYLAGKAFAQ